MHESQLNQSHGFGRLGLGLWLGLATLGGCDPSDDLDDPRSHIPVFDGVVELEPIVEVVDQVAASADPVPAPDEHDGCGLDQDHTPVGIHWALRRDAMPELEVEFRRPVGSADTVELQFYTSPMPSDDGRVHAVGRAVSVRADGRVAMPVELIELVRSGDAYQTFALLDTCYADDPQASCSRANSSELYIEDGQIFGPDEYPRFLRDKWAAEKPWLFTDGVVTNVVDMKGQ